MIVSDILYAKIIWDENETPISVDFSDVYYSRIDGRSETRYIFLSGNKLPNRWYNGIEFVIAELGFGTGLNFLETIAHWQTFSSGGKLNYVAFEKFPMSKVDLKRALKPWNELSEHASKLIDFWPPNTGWSKYELDGSVTLHLAIGDAKAMLEAWNADVDAWYLDGFSPAKNPDLWEADLIEAMVNRTTPGGTFATFTAAGWVRRNLKAAGFKVEKIPGFGRKRECLRGDLIIK
ncbi:MAG: tRNA (5-methylaminomethyl-2-thiouridine)(34)-methyltransferase MnmD [Hyphomicrobiaceae bacterium]|nr:tRNA (5-methylaminomethyl-2-thiouridine)(34)-methyltransferase MnmD [Hyphomicrobiaceae bacterium]